MGKIIDHQIEEEIENGLKINHATNQQIHKFTLPRFDKTESGEYVYVGNSVVTTLKEFQEYMKSYGEVAKSLDNYTEIVSKIYKNALNSLIAENGIYQFGKNDYSLPSKLASGQFNASAVANMNTESYEKTLNYITKAAFKTKRLKPASNLNSMMKKVSSSKKAESKFFVLPVMTENGIVLSHNRNTQTFEANFETISAENALEIKEYLLSSIKNLNPIQQQQLTAQVEKLFKNAKQIGEMVEAGYDNGLENKLEKLANDFSDLIGVDLSHYNKGLRKAPVPAKPLAEKGATTEKKTSVDVKEILIDGTYKTAPALESGKVVTKITPDGYKFTLQLKNDKFYVTTVSNQKDENFDFNTLERQ